VIPFAFFSLLAALTAVYILFLFRLRAGLRFLALEEEHEPPFVGDPLLPAVTVIVPARNEEAQIAACIGSLAAQRYPKERMEVLVLDDHSEDATRGRAEAAMRDDGRFRIITVDGAGKKAAVTQGVREARGEVIVTTDADCLHGESWLLSMCAPFGGEADIVAGPVVYTGRATLFQRLQALEFLGLMGVGAGFIGIGYPRLCNGANLAYRRECFIAVSGFEGNAGVHSGDDEFLLHKIVYQAGGIARFVTRQDALVRTAASHNVRAFLRQRIRWASKGRRYDDGRFVAFLVLLFAYFLFAAAAPFVGLTSLAALLAALVFFLLKATADTAVLYSAATLFRQPVRAADVLAAELLHAYYLVFVSLVGFFGGYTWKNRRIRDRRT
jgi:cellulose synthase/poly-beta-1,6-N-acetylglucosamine synthase-like glycosyltransferase